MPVVIEVPIHHLDTTDVHGIVDTAALETTAGSATKVETHRADTTDVHGIPDTSLIETQSGAQAKVDAETAARVTAVTAEAAARAAADAAEVAARDAAIETHRADTTTVHGIADTAALGANVAQLVDRNAHASMQAAADAAWGKILHVTETVTIAVPSQQATIQAALDACARWTLKPGVKIRIVVTGHLTVTTATPVALVDHGIGPGIEIVGATPVNANMLSIASVGGVAGAWAVTAQLDTVAGISVGDVVLVTGTAPGVWIPGSYVGVIPDNGIRLGYFITGSAEVSTVGTTATLTKTAGGAGDHTGVLAVGYMMLINGLARRITALPTASTITLATALPVDVTERNHYWYYAKTAVGTIRSSGTTVTGENGAAFQTGKFNVGDLLWPEGDLGPRRIVSIDGPTTLTVDQAWKTDIATGTVYSCITHGVMHDGAFVITAVDIGLNRITWSNPSRSTRLPPPVKAVTTTAIKVLKSVVTQTGGGGGVHVYGTSLGLVDDIAFVGPVTADPATGGTGVSLSGWIHSLPDGSPGRMGQAKLSDTVAIVGFADGAQIQGAGNLEAPGAFICGAGIFGVRCHYGGRANLANATINGTVKTGVYCGPGAHVHCSDIRLVGCGPLAFWVDTGGNIYCDFGYIYGGTTNGLYEVGGTTVQWVGCWVVGCAEYGVQVTNAATGRYSGSLLVSNGLAGFSATRSPLSEAAHMWSCGNGFAGVEAIESRFGAPELAAVGNGTAGVHARDNSDVSLDDAYIAGNKLYGVRADRKTTVLAQRAYAGGNQSADWFAEVGAEIVLTTPRGAPVYAPDLNIASVGGPSVTDGSQMALTADRFGTPDLANINDDAVATIAGYSGKTLILMVWATNHNDAWVQVKIRPGAGADATVMVAGSAGAVTTGALTGTTGTDGKLTVSAHTDGLIYIENRLGIVVALKKMVIGS